MWLNERVFVGILEVLWVTTTTTTVIVITVWTIAVGTLMGRSATSEATPSFERFASNMGTTLPMIFAAIAKAQTDKMEESLRKTDDLVTQAAAQSRATNTLAKEAALSSAAARANANAAQDAVKIAAQNLELAQNSLRVQERPWVGTTRFDGHIEGDLVNVNVNMSNFGKSPAFHVMPHGGWSTSQPLPGHFYPLQQAAKSAAVMMPQATKELEIPPYDLSTLTPQNRLAFSQGLLKLYCYGEITYSDVFTQGDSGTEHATHFCGVWDVKSNKFLDCTYYNGAD